MSFFYQENLLSIKVKTKICAVSCKQFRGFLSVFRVHSSLFLYATRFDIPTIMTMQWICKLVEPHCNSQPLPAIPVALFYSLSFLSVLFLTCLTVKLSILLSTDDIMALGFCCMCGRLRWTPHRSTRNKKKKIQKKPHWNIFPDVWLRGLLDSGVTVNFGAVQIARPKTRTNPNRKQDNFRLVCRVYFIPVWDAGISTVTTVRANYMIGTLCL